MLDLPASSPALDHVLALDPLVILVTALRTRALADADAAVSRLLESGPASAGGPDVRVVTRGPRPPDEVVDDVVAHLGVGHLHHLADDARVPRDAERGLFPGVARDAVRRCADVVVGAVDGLAEAS